MMSLTRLRKGMSPLEIEQLVGAVFRKLSLREKVAQMTGSSSLLKLAADTYLFRHYNRSPYPASGVRPFGIPPLLFSDGPRGVVMNRSTCFPVSMARGASWDPDLEGRIGEAIGREIRALGGNYYGGVCINLLRHPAWGRAQETYGEDPFHLAAMGVALLRGVQRHNVMACAKHFACNSIENARLKVDVRAEERTLREVYLPHFRACVEAGVASIMGAYNKLRGEHCCENPYLLTKVLREDWGFRGFVVSDFVFALHDTRAAVASGLDIEMPSPRVYGRKLIEAVRSGQVSESVVDAAVRRILGTMVRFAAATDPQPYPRRLVGSPEHVQLAREAAEKSIVLLRNDGGLLPFQRSQLRSLAVVGRLADRGNIGDHGSSWVHPPHVVTPLAGLRDYLGRSVEVRYADGSDAGKVQALAAWADAVVVVAGYDHRDEGEYIQGRGRAGGDRDSLSLHGDEIELIRVATAANKACVVVLVGGSAIMMEEWKDTVPAILMSWYGGMEGGAALARTLFGEVNPGGKLPFTIPARAQDLPFFDRNADTIEYGYYHGYTLFEKKGIEPSFPFGFGLSYSSFACSSLQVMEQSDKLKVSAEVNNTGPCAGDEVVQLYVGPAHSAVDRPAKLLRGFRRVHLRPGEQRRLSFEVPYEALAWYNPQKAAWELEKTNHVVHVGTSSRSKDLLTAEIRP
jgi:beta-glucosidase